MCEQRMTYFEQELAWRICYIIDITLLTSHSIIDSIWLSGGSLLTVHRTNNLLEYVLQQNAPLVDFHPQVLLQCLLWGRVDWVKDIILTLANAAAVAERHDSPVAIKIDSQAAQDFWSSEHITVKVVEESSTRVKRQHQLLFDHEDSSDDGTSFSQPVITRLLEFLEKNPMAALTQLDNVHLSILIQTTLEVALSNVAPLQAKPFFFQIAEQRRAASRALDAADCTMMQNMKILLLLDRDESGEGGCENQNSRTNDLDARMVRQGSA
ncbi:hypothetical protein SISSUDRAFT_1068078 [Sistotremastrum suecicum HHB10207 ss-3]|uniref:RAVE complex protein Rav1 C-terminal domain-containing protein n=1 Tax=Sistotremastrum suecicum HHB10207 ss-3 TaxID=1314776 RepID=A0A165WG60_9AGAM|nr:hypothetical protein SISSUDRAFT_1068078 [Sistotremastrum suecicum HHB10207 ss-3]